MAKEKIMDSCKNVILQVEKNSRDEVIVYDARGFNKLGKIEPGSSKKLIAKDKLGRKLGEYDESTDSTRDPIGRKIGKGNSLLQLFIKI